MEFIFGVIGLLVSVGILTFIPYMVYDNWNDTKIALKRQLFYDNGILGVFYVLIGIILAMVIFITLCAFNNTFWHLDYLTTVGIWKR